MDVPRTHKLSFNTGLLPCASIIYSLCWFTFNTHDNMTMHVPATLVSESVIVCVSGRLVSVKQWYSGQFKLIRQALNTSVSVSGARGQWFILPALVLTG